MFATLLGSIAAVTALVDGPPPPITVSFSDGGQYNVGAYAQVQFRAAADGYVIIFQADQDGRVRVLFPLDPGDDDFIRGGKTYKIIGRDSRGSFYLDDAGGSGMVFAAWSKSPFRFAEFTRGDHWDFSILDQYNASDDPESQLTDLALHMTDQGFDYAIDRYIVFNTFVESSTTNTFIGVSGWPWPAFSTGWTVGVGFGSPCCFNPWFWNPWPSSVWWGSAGWGWGWGWGWAGAPPLLAGVGAGALLAGALLAGALLAGGLPAGAGAPLVPAHTLSSPVERSLRLAHRTDRAATRSLRSLQLSRRDIGVGRRSASTARTGWRTMQPPSAAAPKRVAALLPVQRRRVSRAGLSAARLNARQVGPPVVAAVAGRAAAVPCRPR